MVLILAANNFGIQASPMFIIIIERDGSDTVGEINHDTIHKVDINHYIYGLLSYIKKTEASGCVVWCLRSTCTTIVVQASCLIVLISKF
jgi:hypothetical protein